MKISIHWKFTFIFLFVITFILILNFFYLSKNLNIFLEARLKENFRKELLLSKELLELYSSHSQTPPDWDSLADRIGNLLNLRVTVVSLEGTVLGDSEIDRVYLPEIENHLNRQEIQEAIKKGFGESRRFSNTIGKDMLYMAIPHGKDEFSGILRLSIPVSEIKMLEANLQRTILFALFLALVFSIGLSFSVAKMVSRPILKISSLAKEIARGNFPQEQLFYVKDEIGELAESIQYMSKEIRNKINYITSEEAKLRAVISSLVEGLMITDKEGEIISVNPGLKKMFYIEYASMGKKPLEVIRNNKVQSMVERILKGESRFLSDEVEINFPQEKIIRINGTPIIRDNEIEGVVVVFHDITELKRLEKMRQDFVANVSHELRTPLTSIKGYAETLLEDNLEDKEKARDFLGIIYHDAECLSRLIDDLLDLSKIESGKFKMNFSEVDLNKIIEHSLKILEEQLRNKDIYVELNLVKDLPKVWADKIRITQVMLNLLDNAIKYNVDKGKILISASLRDNFVAVDISDTGIGIPEGDLPHIFERFYRVDKARSRELGGTGLGLSIVKHIIQAHGGEIFVKSEPSKGSTFTFTLPKA